MVPSSFLATLLFSIAVSAVPFSCSSLTGLSTMSSSLGFINVLMNENTSLSFTSASPNVRKVSPSKSSMSAIPIWSGVRFTNTTAAITTTRISTIIVTIGPIMHPLMMPGFEGCAIIILLPFSFNNFIIT